MKMEWRRLQRPVCKVQNWTSDRAKPPGLGACDSLSEHSPCPAARVNPPAPRKPLGAHMLFSGLAFRCRKNRAWSSEITCVLQAFTLTDTDYNYTETSLFHVK